VIKTLDLDPDPDLDPMRNRIHIDLKCWIRICIESNADLKHWF
jgi:hypothetical protein